MGKIMHVNVTNARFHPDREFGAPEALAESPALTRGQKITAHDRWSQQLLSRIGQGSEDALVDRRGDDPAMLGRVQAAVGALKRRDVGG